MYCENCETTWEYASIRCPDCRSRLVSQSSWLEKLCKTAPIEETSLFVGADISAAKAANVRTHYPIGNDSLLLLIDATVFGSAKVGVAIGSNGIYWSTDWTTSSKRHSLDWEAFAQRDLKLDDYAVDLGQGDLIDLAAVGNAQDRKTIFEFLGRVQTAARAHQRGQK